jgi:DNA-binding PadR family transcriptional regulator
MSNRYEVISAIKSDPADVEQIAGIVGDKITRKQIRDTLRDCVTAGLVERKQDAGLYYAITKKGVEWLKDQTGDYITAPARPETIEDIVVPPPPTYDPDSVCFDAHKREAAKDAEIAELKAKVAWLDDIQTMTQKELNEHKELIGRIGVQLINVTADTEGCSIEHKVAQVCHDLIHAESERNAWRDMAAMYGHETPVDLAGYIGEQINTALATATTVPTDSQEPTLGFIVAAIVSDEPVFATQEDARLAAIINASSTGLRSSVLRIIDTVESVKVEWASDSKKSIES